MAPIDQDRDVAAAAQLFGEPARTRMLMALADGRALPASMLADEAGVSPATASAHLGRLVDGGLLAVEASGRHRYYRLAGPQVARVIEALGAVAGPLEVRSLRDGTKAHAIREARSCYDHLAGRLGVAVTAALVEHGALETTDDDPTTARRETDPIAAPVKDAPYRLGPNAEPVLAELGVDLDALPTTRRPLLRVCVDYTEQRHHVAGGLGAAVLDSLLERGWVARGRVRRALTLTDAGADGLGSALGIAA